MASKQKSTAQIKAEATRQAELRFREQLKTIKAENERLKEQNKRLRDEKFELAQKVENIDLLKDHIAKLEDWNNRLQEYMDLPPDQFKREIERMRQEEQYTQLLGLSARMMSHFTSGIF